DGEHALRFVEKPTLEVARRYVESGRFLWNSGMFCLQTGALLQELEDHCPEVLEPVRACHAQSPLSRLEGGAQISLDAESFAEVPDVSIDYALMEKSSHVSVIPCDIGWSDIGCWTALGKLSSVDRDGNSVEGQALLHDTHGCY